MATVSVDKQILEEYTWGSYPYETWKGDVATTWASAYRANTVVEVDEDYISVLGKDKLGSHIRKTFSHNISLLDVFSRTVAYVLNIKDKIDVDETYWDNIKFFLQFSENIKPRDSFTKSYAANHNEAFKILEHLAKETNKLITVKLIVSDKMLTENIFNREFAERVIAKELFSKELSRDFIEDAFYVDDVFSKENILNVHEVIPTIVDVMRRTAIFHKTIQDGINVLEVPIKQLQKVSKENIVVKDVILRASNAIISDIYISEKLYSDEDFKDVVNTMGGYTPFIDFKVGEYQYKDAMVRVILQSDSQAEPTAQGITMHVDIPDTDDRGTITISNTTEAIYVQFNKHYYTVPEVQVTLRGGSSASGNITPHIVTIDTHGFYVELLNASGRTTGTISWVSKGY